MWLTAAACFAACGSCSRVYANFVGGVDPWVWQHGGIKVVGATLWFGSPSPTAPTHAMNDYQVIPGFASWCEGESRSHLAFLARHVDSRTIVVTHHLPAVAWIHGHSHEVLGERVSDTLLVRNPFGYAPHDLVGDSSTAAQLEISGD